MENHEILVNAMSADAVVKTYAQNLDTFGENAGSAAGSLRAAIDGIERGWSGETYDLFRSEMNQQISLLENCVGRVSDLSAQLHEISAQFSAMIEMLRRAGE